MSYSRKWLRTDVNVKLSLSLFSSTLPDGPTSIYGTPVTQGIVLTDKFPYPP